MEHIKIEHILGIIALAILIILITVFAVIAFLLREHILHKKRRSLHHALDYNVPRVIKYLKKNLRGQTDLSFKFYEEYDMTKPSVTITVRVLDNTKSDPQNPSPIPLCPTLYDKLYETDGDGNTKPRPGEVKVIFGGPNGSGKNAAAEGFAKALSYQKRTFFISVSCLAIEDTFDTAKITGVIKQIIEEFDTEFKKIIMLRSLRYHQALIQIYKL